MPLLELLQEMLEARKPTNGLAVRNWRVTSGSFQHTTHSLQGHSQANFTDSNKIQNANHDGKNNTAIQGPGTHYHSHDQSDLPQNQQHLPASQPASPPVVLGPPQRIGPNFFGHTNSVHSQVTSSSGMFPAANHLHHSSMGIPQPRSSVLEDRSLHHPVSAVSMQPHIPVTTPAHFAVRNTSSVMVPHDESFPQRVPSMTTSDSSSMRGYHPPPLSPSRNAYGRPYVPT